MKIADVKAIAAQRGMKAGRTTKGELIRSIQAREGSNPCFDSGRAGECGQAGCLWRDDCDRPAAGRKKPDRTG